MIPRLIQLTMLVTSLAVLMLDLLFWRP
jgi:hypothetical protein